MKNGRVSLCVNISIIVTLIVFTGLVVSLLKILLHIHSGTGGEKSIEDIKNRTLQFRYKPSKLCPGHYKHWMQAIFLSYHDGNCSFPSVHADSMRNDASKNDVINVHNDKKMRRTEYNGGNGIRIIKPKSVQVTDWILALMLIASVISAFVEMLRNRFMNYQDTYMRIGSLASKRPSIIGFVLPERCSSRKPNKPQVTSGTRGYRRTPPHAPGAYRPTLLRRSSFPVHFDLDGSKSDLPTSPGSPRQESANFDEEAGICAAPGLPRHSRLIRRR